jgi:hypothetical protein
MYYQSQYNVFLLNNIHIVIELYNYYINIIELHCHHHD